MPRSSEIASYGSVSSRTPAGELSKPAIFKKPVSVASRPCLVIEERIQGGVWISAGMAKSNKQIENRQWQTDALVYQAIRYLDSPTDYRECLPHMAQSKVVQDQEHPKESAVEKDDFILLDETPLYQLNGPWTFVLIALLLGVVLLGLLQS